jgi:hypothetical protein
VEHPSGGARNIDRRMDYNPAGCHDDLRVMARCYKDGVLRNVFLSLVSLCLLAGCSSMLPRSKEVTASPWQSYQEAQNTFDKIIPGQTTMGDLKLLHLDPDVYPNIAILNYSDVHRRFAPHAGITMADLDTGVRDCILAKMVCKGYEINQKEVKKQREGNVVADVLGFYRETHTTGWKFQGLLLLKEGIVVYKLTGGQPVILEQESSRTPLGPLQGIGQKLFGGWL